MQIYAFFPIYTPLFDKVLLKIQIINRMQRRCGGRHRVSHPAGGEMVSLDFSRLHLWMRMSGNGGLLLCATIFFSRERYLVMSHTDGNTFGLEHGKIGDRIAVVLNGKQVYKRLYKPTNPRTPKQQMHRAKLAYINRLSGWIHALTPFGSS